MPLLQKRISSYRNKKAKEKRKLKTGFIMINHEELRQRYRPTDIKILFIAEAPPEADTFFYSAKSFFYTYTKQVFEAFFKEEIDRKEFLDFFKTTGFYLDDLSHTPMAFNEICSKQDSLIKDLKDRINLYSPITSKNSNHRKRTFNKNSRKDKNRKISQKGKGRVTLKTCGNSGKNKDLYKKSGERWETELERS